MAWQAPKMGLRRSVEAYAEVTVDASDFKGEQLLQGLIDLDWITEDEAERILAAQKGGTAPAAPPVDAKTQWLNWQRELAESELAVGRKAEALIHIERFLGQRWLGVITQ